MNSDYINIMLNLGGAIVAGGVIGLERSYHGRPAGFRTHTMVCLSSALLMLITLYQSHWLPGTPLNADPTRMAQGIMTGIGFLGAGVIYKENLSVRGLTTASSIWITAAIGILFGIGFYFPAVLTTLLALGVLSLFRHIESAMPIQMYATLEVGFNRDAIMPEPELRALLTRHGFKISTMGYRILDSEQLFLYTTVIRSGNDRGTAQLAKSFSETASVRGFNIVPIGD